MKILVIGAARSGTSTLGEAIAHRCRAAFIEADSLYWLPTTPPFTAKRPADERRLLLVAALDEQAACVVAGSVMGWGAQIEDAFDLVIFLRVPAAVRLQRLEHREIQLFGRANPAFLEWAAQYDEGTQPGRSLARHTAWLEARSCRVIRLEGNHSVEELLSMVAPLLPGFSGDASFAQKPVRRAGREREQPCD